MTLGLCDEVARVMILFLLRRYLKSRCLDFALILNKYHGRYGLDRGECEIGKTYVGMRRVKGEGGCMIVRLVGVSHSPLSHISDPAQSSLQKLF